MRNKLITEKRIPTEHDKEQAYIAVDMLVYCSCLMLANMELVESLISENKYKYNVKNRVKYFREKSFKVYSECCRVFGGEETSLCEEFGRRAGVLFDKINKNVYFKGSEKWYQIICSLSIIIEKRNRQLETTYYFRQAEYLYNADKRLECLKYTSNEVVDTIILGLGRVECEIVD